MMMKTIYQTRGRNRSRERAGLGNVQKSGWSRSKSQAVVGEKEQGRGRTRAGQENKLGRSRTEAGAWLEQEKSRVRAGQRQGQIPV